MSFKDISLKKSYSSDEDDILNDFYIPTLETSIEYKRLAGFFSSTSLAVAAKGIYGLIKNNGTMKLIVSPKLSKRDIEIIINSNEEPEKYIEKNMLDELEKFENEIIRDHVYALGWMIANKKLEIKVAIAFSIEDKILSIDDIDKSGLFHQKVGILRDENNNILTFSGSVNETAAGWLGNIEEFKVFRSWENSEEDYVLADTSKFNRFWNNQSLRVKVIEIPKAVERKFIEIAPLDIGEINIQKLYNKIKRRKELKLWQHQKDAIKFWLKNGMKVFFEMATGTGKTYAALGCINEINKFTQKFLVIITCPKSHLVQQWKREINKFGINYESLIIADSSNPYWKNNLTDSLIDNSMGYKNKILILTTHDTFFSKDFKKIIQNNKSNSDIFLIADEVHGLGAEKRKMGLIDDYNLRLGLSATPKRWFDDVGTHKIYNYFGNTVYEFGLEKALNAENPDTGESYLTPYRYLPKFVSLTSEELEEYVNKTRAIAVKFNNIRNDEEKDKFLENLLFKRADIIKNAAKKYEILEEILNEMESPINFTLIYCSHQQIDEIMYIINKRRLIAHRFTMKEGIKPHKKYNGLSQRDFILQKFAERKYQILVAMKCLDEGVDIPPARNTILMASSGNPREYIQRIGRVIRIYKDKKEAIIYDIIIVPSFNKLPPEFINIEWRIFNREVERYMEIAKIANNGAEALKLIFEIKNKYLEGKNE